MLFETRRPLLTALACAGVLCSAADGWADDPTPWGPQIFLGNFDVNVGGGVAMDPSGNLTVSFDFFFGGPAARGVAADGTLGGFFVIQPYGALITFDPIASTALATDDYFFVWEGFVEGLQGRRYAADGTPLDDPVQITAGGGTFFDVEPAVARWAPGDDLLVVWATDDPATGDGDGLGIDGHAFAADGTPLGPTFRVNAITGGNQQAPDVAIAAGAGILVVWESDGAGGDGDGFGIRAHRFSASGTTIALFQVNASSPGDQRRPAVAMAPDGTALVVWQAPSPATGHDLDIFGRLFDAAGDPLSDDFRINTSLAGDQSLPDVAWFAAGCFQAVWRSSSGVHSQAVAADGQLLGDELLVSTTTGALPFKRPTVAAAGPWSAVSWAEEDPSAFDDVYVQRFRSGVFADGFESGDTARWSSTIP